MVLDTARKEFDIYHPETNNIVKVEMSVKDYLAYMQNERLIKAIGDLKKHG